MAIAEPVVTELTIDARGADRGQAQYVRAMANAQAAMERTLAASTRLWEQHNQQARVTQQVAAANDNLARSYGAANDNAASAQKSFAATAVGAAEMASHLKLAAVAAYTLSPAFRALVNPAVSAGLRATGGALAAMSPAAATVAAVIGARLLPALSFVARLAAPIFLVVEAFKALNAITELGAARLKTVAELQEAAFKASGMLRPERKEVISTEEVSQANALNDRMNAATKLIEERWLPLKRDLVQLGVNYNETWVQLQELIAGAIGFLQQLYDKAKSAPGTLSKAINDTLKPWLPTPTDEGAKAAGVQVVPDTKPIDDAREALKRYMADARLVQQQTLQTADAGRLFRKEKEKEADTTKAAATEFDRLERSMERGAAVQEAEALAVGVSVGEHARLRAEMRLQEAALQDIAKHGGTLEDYAERIKKVADRWGAAAQKAAELKLQSDIKFTGDTMFFSDIDKQIASILRQTYGAEWKNMMDGPIAGAMRWNATLKEVRDTSVDLGKSLLQSFMQGKTGAEALAGALDQLASKMASGAIDDLASGNFISAGVKAGIAAISHFLSKDLQEAKKEAERQERAREARRSADELTRGWRGTEGSEVARLRDEQLRFGMVHGQLSAAKEWGAAAALKAEFEQWKQSIARDFNANWPGMLEALRSGSSAFGQATSAVQAMSKEVQAFIVDSVFFLPDLVDKEAKLAEIRQVAQQRLLGMIEGTPELSRVAEEMQRIAGTAAALQKALQDAGMSAADAAKAIEDRVKVAMDKLRKSFQDDINREINDLSGRGFINDVNDAIRIRDQQRRDAAALGLSTVDIDRLFALKVQEIVNRAGLVGTAFDDLIRLFPELTGVVQESTDAIERQKEEQIRAAKEIADFLTANTRRIQEFRDAMKSGSDSPLSPAARLAAAQSGYNAQFALAQAGNRDALTGITQYAQSLIEAARDFHGSSAGFQAIFNQIDAQLAALQTPVSGDQYIVDAIIAQTTTLGGLLATLDTNGDSMISRQEAANSFLNSIFSELDLNGDGQLSKLELIRAASQGTRDNVAASNALLAASNNLIEAVRQWGQSNNAVLAAIQVLQTTANAQLTLLTTQLASAVSITLPASGSGGFGNAPPGFAGGVTFNNTVIAALDKIALNTQLIVRNTYSTWEAIYRTAPTQFTVQSLFSSTTPHPDGVHAAGGLIGGLPHSMGGTHIEAERGEYMLREWAASRIGIPALDYANRTGSLPVVPVPVARNDNGPSYRELIQKVDELTKEVTRLQQIVAGANARVAQAVVEKGDELVEAYDRQTDTLASAQRQSDRKSRAA